MRYLPPRAIKVAFTSLFLCGLSSAAIADSNAALIEALVNKGILTAEEAQPLLERAKEEAKQVVKQDAPAPDAKAPAVSVGKKGIVVKSPEGDFSMQVGGRLHADVFAHSGDSDLAGGISGVDGTEIRRGRIYIKGTANSDFKYNLVADFGGNRVSVKDAFLTYTGFNGPLELTVGSQKHAVSMELEESSNDIMFTERSLISGLTAPFDRAIGISLKAKGDDWHVKGGLYGDAISSGSSNNDEGNGFGIRGTYAPINEKGRLFHVGASYGNRSTSDDNQASGRSVSVSRETSNASSLRLLNTGTISDADSVETTVFELAAMAGPLSFQSEIAQTTIERETNPDVDFSGFYAQVGYTLTGESRTYKGSDGEFKRLKPARPFDLQNGGWGAWELAARYDELDLNDGLVAGGDGTRITLGVNWYLNENIRVLADYSTIFDIDNGPVVKNDGSDADDIDVVTVRAQWAF